ncbi:MAG: hypothetical protein H6724_17380 [Sandaracinus sp.]|nr:hypothetical protein [Sandaracinus sp.]
MGLEVLLVEEGELSDDAEGPSLTSLPYVMEALDAQASLAGVRRLSDFFFDEEGVREELEEELLEDEDEADEDELDERVEASLRERQPWFDASEIAAVCEAIAAELGGTPDPYPDGIAAGMKRLTSVAVATELRLLAKRAREAEKRAHLVVL